jgi:uncharacterized FAD-dependent dehydrogenase
MSRTVDIERPLSEPEPPQAGGPGHSEALRAALAAAGEAVPADAHVRLLLNSVDLRRRRSPVRRLRIAISSAGYRGWAPSAAPARGDVLIVGAGPAGTFAALEAVALGLRPIIVERGKPVRPRRADLQSLTTRGELQSDSNYCFGEGGAGTFSDGKLYTRVKDKAGVRQVLETLVHFGAPARILSDAHPHVGSNRLPPVLVALREWLEAQGAEYHWETRVERLIVEHGRVVGVGCAGGAELRGAAVLLCTGHSATDIYQMVVDQGVATEVKSFAVGVRVEHPQGWLDARQHRGVECAASLPAASYSLACQVDGLGVYSFCMCPGGYIVPAATDPGALVVNGMSLAKRGSPFANSGLVVTVDPAAMRAWAQAEGQALDDPLLGLAFRRHIETAGYRLGGGDFVAPAQRVTDVLAERLSSSLPETSYRRGVVAAPVLSMFPAGLAEALRQALPLLDAKLPGLLSEQGVFVGCETRTSSPLRIGRGADRASLSHPGLYPVGEGAGYAGGIVSAAIDGIESLRAAAAAGTGGG